MNQPKRAINPFPGLATSPPANNLFGQPLPTPSAAALKILEPLMAEADIARFDQAQKDNHSKAIADVDDTVRRIFDLFRETERRPQIGPALKAVLSPDQRTEMERLEAETVRLRQEQLANLLGMLVHSYAAAYMVRFAELPRLLRQVQRERTGPARKEQSDTSDLGRQLVYGCIRSLLSKGDAWEDKGIAKKIQKAVDDAVKALPADIKRPRLGPRAVRKYVAEYFRGAK